MKFRKPLLASLILVVLATLLIIGLESFNKTFGVSIEKIKSLEEKISEYPQPEEIPNIYELVDADHNFASSGITPLTTTASTTT